MSINIETYPKDDIGGDLFNLKSLLLDQLKKNQESLDKGWRPKTKVEKVKNPEITKREGNLCYCKVHPGDTIPKIRERLSQYPEFSYLKERTYGGDGRNVSGFNIEPRHLKAGMNLMIPLPIEDRQVEYQDFIGSCQMAIKNMESNVIYGERIKKLVNTIGKNNLARVMAAFARVETAAGDPNTKIGTGCLYRYETTDTYSISYYHIIMKRGGLAALNNLNLSQGDTCDPVKAGMLFLGFWCEVENDVKRKKLTLEKCLNPNEKNRYNNAAMIYNSGSASYAKKLKGSFYS